MRIANAPGRPSTSGCRGCRDVGDVECDAEWSADQQRVRHFEFVGAGREQVPSTPPENSAAPIRTARTAPGQGRDGEKEKARAEEPGRGTLVVGPVGVVRASLTHWSTAAHRQSHEQHRRNRTSACASECRSSRTRRRFPSSRPWETRPLPPCRSLRTRGPSASMLPPSLTHPTLLVPEDSAICTSGASWPGASRARHLGAAPPPSSPRSSPLHRPARTDTDDACTPAGVGPARSPSYSRI